MESLASWYNRHGVHKRAATWYKKFGAGGRVLAWGARGRVYLLGIIHGVHEREFSCLISNMGFRGEWSAASYNTYGGKWRVLLLEI